MRSVAPKLTEQLMEESRRLAEVSKRVREESMKVNAEFAAIERDLDEPGPETGEASRW